jgi:hypothetical protein
MMKKLVIIALAIVAFSCDKTCKTASTDARCKETAPTNEMCQAYFQRWFFNAAENECELKAYSGCSEKGFATRGECETCGCKD